MRTYTLKELLDEIKEQTPKLEKGIYLEVLKSIYPTGDVSNELKNVIIEEKELTLPLACSSKAKKQFKKDKCVFFEFFKDNIRGDFLEIIETDGYNAKCVNRSIKEEYYNKYYKDLQIINIKFDDIVNGTVKRVYRGINKYIK